MVTSGPFRRSASSPIRRTKTSLPVALSPFRVTTSFDATDLNTWSNCRMLGEP
jgi:hypothetical protein